VAEVANLGSCAGSIHMLDFGPTAFQRSGTAAPVLCSITATSLSSRVPAGQQIDPARRTPGFWRWPACRDRGDGGCCPLTLSSHRPYELAPSAGYFGRTSAETARQDR